MFPTLPLTPLSAVLSWLTLLNIAFSLKFDLNAHSGSSGKYQRCIRNFVSRETLVVVTATISGTKGDGQVVNMLVGTPLPVVGTAADICSQIKDTQDNEYGKPKDVVGETRLAFTSHTDSAFDVCFENILTGRGTQIPDSSKHLLMLTQPMSQTLPAMWSSTSTSEQTQKIGPRYRQRRSSSRWRRSSGALRRWLERLLLRWTI